jgi:hypothetical protein
MFDGPTAFLKSNIVRCRIHGETIHGEGKNVSSSMPRNGET